MFLWLMVLKRLRRLCIADALRRAQMRVTMVSIMRDRTVTGSHAIQVTADAVFEDFDWRDADMLVLPGGSVGAAKLGCA